jgi:polar amino acid transport system substrate-binding protein
MHNGYNRRKTVYPLLLTAVLWMWLILYTPSTAVATEFKDIQQRGYLTIAVKDNLRPLGFKDNQGKLQGLEIDLAQRLAQDLLGKADAVKLQPVANRDRLSLVMDHKVDLAIARVTATESRSRIVNFSLPYYYDGTTLITKDITPPQKIAVLQGSTTIAVVKYYYPRAKLVGVDSYSQALTLLEANTADAFAADASVLSGWVQEYPQYHLIKTPLSTEPLSVVMAKGLQSDQLRQQVNAAIARYLAEGWLQERATYWGLPQSDLIRGSKS